ncbi:MAG: hypothetical protein J6A79_08050 [Clostridia bacterium]|nr:hypothetical protein [Clostridia bacterium]
MSTEGKYTIRIDTKYYRICVHKITLSAIGDPEFVRLGYEPNSKQLMLLGVGSDMYKAIRVRFTTGGSFFIHCKGLIQALQRTGQIMKEEGSYLLNGDLMAEEPAITFPLKTAELISTEMEENVQG